MASILNFLLKSLFSTFSYPCAPQRYHLCKSFHFINYQLVNKKRKDKRNVIRFSNDGIQSYFDLADESHLCDKRFIQEEIVSVTSINCFQFEWIETERKSKKKKKQLALIPKSVCFDVRSRLLIRSLGHFQ